MTELDNDFAYSTLRFTKKDNHMLTEKERYSRSFCDTLIGKSKFKDETLLPIAYPTEIFLITPQERKERLAYLRFRLRVIATCFFFMFRLRRQSEINHTTRLSKLSNTLIVESKAHRERVEN